MNRESPAQSFASYIMRCRALLSDRFFFRSLPLHFSSYVRVGEIRFAIIMASAERIMLQLPWSSSLDFSLFFAVQFRWCSRHFETCRIFIVNFALVQLAGKFMRDRLNFKSKPAARCKIASNIDVYLNTFLTFFLIKASLEFGKCSRKWFLTKTLDQH